jgi:phosphoribosylanthranilate isomerase
MVKIKICGITNPEDAQAAVEAGADMLGFVFADSPRRINAVSARVIIAGLPPSVTPVGVFMNSPVEYVMATAKIANVSIIQLHGDETPEIVDRLPFDVIRRIAVHPGDQAADLIERMDRWPCRAYLLDPGAGAGRAFEWSIARGIERSIYLAGGLTPENVADAIRLICPYAVDVSSGVEQSPDRKDRQKMIDLVRAVRECNDDSDV